MQKIIQKFLLLLSIILLVALILSRPVFFSSPFSCDNLYDSDVLCLDSETLPVEDWYGSGNYYLPPKNSPLKSCGNRGFHSVQKATLFEPAYSAAITTPELSYPGCYQLTVWYRVGSLGQNEENFNLVCGENTYDFFDVDLVNSERDHPALFNPTTPVPCKFQAGANTISLIGLGNSVHIDQFQLTSCIKDSQALCGSSPPQTRLPFFTLFNFTMAFLIIIIIYLLYSITKNPKKRKYKH